jgi:DNA-binding transcriptional LysR family regulator
MDRITSMAVFSKVVELAGFAAAGRSAGISTAMVSKHVAALEAHLGVPLLARTTRRVSPTEEGSRYYAHCQEILQMLADADGEVGMKSREPVGCLRVTAPVEFGNLHVSPLISTLLRRHPDLSISMNLSNRVVDLAEEGLDVAVRIAANMDTSLRGRHIASSDLLLVASPRYLERRGAPRKPEDLGRHSLLSFSMGPGEKWPFSKGTEQFTMPVQPRLISTSSEALRTAACAGEGIGLLPTFLVGDELARGKLVCVMPAWRHATLKIYVLYPNRRVQPARLRVFIDALVGKFGETPERDCFAPRIRTGHK